MNSPQGWGRMIEDTINYGREDRSSIYKKIDRSTVNFDEYDQSSFVMIYSRTDSVGVLNLPIKAIVLMEVRCDGSFGFPGGLVDDGETPRQACQRELKESAAWCGTDETISDSDYLFSHVDENKELVMHFFATEVCEMKIREIERSLPLSPTYGVEIMGVCRVPLFIMGDAFKGFPCFLKNQFCGCSKLQLLEALCSLKFLTEEQIVQALYSSPNITD